MATTAPTVRQTALSVEVIKQWPGQLQVDRRVVVQVPGRFFPQLQPAEQAISYRGEACEYKERHKFGQHLKAWGSAHTGPGIRIICRSDAIDDPDYKGFWTTLGLFNRWRHDTYKNDREAEKQYLDELPASDNGADGRASAASTAPDKKEEPAVKKHFVLVSTGTHTYGGSGRLAGKSATAYFFACTRDGCSKNHTNPLKQIGSGTGQLYVHLESCQPVLAKQLRAASKHSPVNIDDDGNEYTLFNFQDLLPHHIRFVEKCFRGFDHFKETRQDNGLLDWVRGFEKRAGAPHRDTCVQILEVYEEWLDERIQKLIDMQKAWLGTPFAGSQSDLWSMKSARATFGCMRLSLILDGDMLSGMLGTDEYKGQLVDCSPIIAFDKFLESRHTGANLARWKTGINQKWGLKDAVKVPTEDGASNNKKACKILGQEMHVCLDHDTGRAVLYAAGEAGKPSQNPELKDFTKRSSSQAACFSRSVVNNAALQDAQLEAGRNANELLHPKVKNVTRWTGLYDMCNRNRRIGPEMRVALTGEEDGLTLEEAAITPAPAVLLSDNSSESGAGSDGEDQEEANRSAGKEFPMAHRALTGSDVRANDIFESLLERPRELTLLPQQESKLYGEGLDQGLAYMLVEVMVEEAKAERVEIIYGRDAEETYKEVSALALPLMFQKFRKILVEQCTKRFSLDSTPPTHVLLALKLHPAINTDPDGDLFSSKSAVHELATGEYIRALRRQAIRELGLTSSTSTISALPSITPATVAEPNSAAQQPSSRGSPKKKKRRGLMAAMTASQASATPESGPDMSMVDAHVNKEIAAFEEVSKKMLGNTGNEFYHGSERFNLRTFWAAHKKVLPIHYRVYMAEVGPNKAASANVETVFSGAGKFSKEAELASPDLLRRMVRLHYAWKYAFLRAPNKDIVDRYNKKHHPALHDMLARQAEVGQAAESSPSQPGPSQASAVATEELRESSPIGREMIECEEAVAAVTDEDGFPFAV